MVDLSIIIVNANTRDFLKNCLESIPKNTYKISYEIYVVDDNSQDGSQKMVRDLFPKVNLIQNRENLGFSKSNNRAIKICSGSYVILLNPDTIVMPNALDVLVEFMDNNPEVGAVGPKLIYPDSFSVQPSISIFPNSWMIFLQFFKFRNLLPTSNLRKYVAKYVYELIGKTIKSYFTPYLDNLSPMAVEALSGACLLVRKEVIDQVGLLDENFFMYYEDVDWCLRIKKAGWENFYLPTSEVIHFVGQSFGSKSKSHSPISESIRSKSVCYYFAKHHGKKSLRIIKAIIISAFLIRILALVPYCILDKGRKKIKANIQIYWKAVKSTAYFKIHQTV